MDGSTDASITRFIQHSQEFQPLLSNESGQEDWDAEAPARGTDLSDYRPDPNTVIPPPATSPLTEHDLGPLPIVLADHKPQSPKDVEDSTAEVGVCGLLNIGNTCYMSAGLQCLRSISSLAHHYIDSKVMLDPLPLPAGDVQVDRRLACKGHLSARFSTLVRKLWSGRFSALHPRAFKTTLGILHPHFADSRQQDCHEFLALLLNTLHEEFKGHSSPQANGTSSTNGSASLGSHDESSSVSSASTESRDQEGSSNGQEEAPANDETKTSVVTATFQGSLKSEVICCSCGHVSAKIEPFVFLSVPLPHGSDRQIEVCWVPVVSEPGCLLVTRLLLTVVKFGTVGDVKVALLDVIGRKLSHDLIIVAEIKDRSIFRIVADSLSLRSLDDAKCHVYAFEMAPLSGAESVEGPQPETDNRPVFGPLPRPQAMGYQALGSGEGEGEDSQDSRTVQTASSAAAPQEGSPRDVSGSETPVSGSCAVRQVQGSDSDSDGRPAKVRRKEEKEGGEEGGGAEAMDCSPLQTPAARNEDAPVVSSAGAGSSTGLGTGVGAGPGMGAGPARAVVLEWRSCAICLEELVDSELLTHRPCGAVLCGGCLKASTQHYGSAGGDLIPCPICSLMVKPSEAFTPLASGSPTENVIRLLQTTVLLRSGVAGSSFLSFGHPALLNLPSSGSGAALYFLLSPLLPLPTYGHDWSLCLTDSKGRYCSRCNFGSGCNGCVIADCELTFDLKPGDHVAITFSNLPEAVMTECCGFQSHPSLGQRRGNELTLEQCLQAFAQKEVLGEENPRPCPECGDKMAVRTLTVHTLPPTLIIHLKRFIFHGRVGSKVDAAVTFPLELGAGLVCGRREEEEGVLELRGCVCHFGTLNCGHYVSYCRHPGTGEWWYYNDESATKVDPSDKDAESVYMLFYQRKTTVPVCLPPVEASFDDEEEMRSLEPLLRLFKPKPLPPPTMPLKRASSETNLSAPPSASASASTASHAEQLNSIVSALAFDHAPRAAKPRLARSSSNPSLGPSLPQPSPAGPGSLLADYRNYSFADEGEGKRKEEEEEEGVGGGVVCLSAKVTPW